MPKLDTTSGTARRTLEGARSHLVSTSSYTVTVMLWKFSPSVNTNSPLDFSKSPFVAAPGSEPLAVPSLVLHFTFITPVGGVLVTFNVTLPSLSRRAYFVLILPLASLKNALGPCFLPPEILARYFSRAFGSGAFC